MNHYDMVNLTFQESRILDGETEIIVRQFQERGGTFHFAHEFSLTRLALREEKTFVLAKAVSKSQLFLASLAFSRPVISYAWLRDCILKVRSI